MQNIFNNIKMVCEVEIRRKEILKAYISKVLGKG